MVRHPIPRPYLTFNAPNFTRFTSDCFTFAAPAEDSTPTACIFILLYLVNACCSACAAYGNSLGSLESPYSCDYIHSFQSICSKDVELLLEP